MIDGIKPRKHGLMTRTIGEVPPGIPDTYVPARNTILLSLALSLAECEQCEEIWIGVSSIDYSGYPDCRPEFIEAFEALARKATVMTTDGGASIRIIAPLITMSKADTIRLGLSLGVDYSMTHSCYCPAPSGLSCGQCDSCTIRLAAWRSVGIDDPIAYEDQP
jgi:7-cyano-7-deazaguanine synthase